MPTDFPLAFVIPDRLRSGVGAGGTDRSPADAAGVPCYLETATQSHIDFYAKRGLEIIGQTEYLGHTLAGTVRQPREQSPP